MIPVQLNIFSYSQHTHPIIAGFLYLADKNAITLKINTCFEKKAAYPHYHMVEAIIKEKKVAFDMLDGYNWNLQAVRDYLLKCDLYVKRSFSSSKNLVFSEDERKKIVPLGCSFHVTHPTLAQIFPVSIKQIIKKIVGPLCGNYPDIYYTPNRFESIPQYNDGKLDIIFYTRLWDNTDCPNHNVDELEYINSMRIEIIRNLYKRYPNHVYAGLSRSKLAEELAPDLILPKKNTARANYLERMKKADICIGTMGLHESVGWKTGEYIAAAKAIVNETLHYDMIGDFLPGRNYLEFSSIESCLECVETLVGNPQYVYDMKLRNREYYLNYLRPDMQVLRAIERIV